MPCSKPFYIESIFKSLYVMAQVVILAIESLFPITSWYTYHVASDRLTMNQKDISGSVDSDPTAGIAPEVGSAAPRRRQPCRSGRIYTNLRLQYVCSPSHDVNIPRAAASKVRLSDAGRRRIRS